MLRDDLLTRLLNAVRYRSVCMSRVKEGQIPTREKLVEAAVRLMLKRGFVATGVDDVCAEAGVTKGAFFHYFKSKEDIGVAALQRWADFGMALYAEAERLDISSDPLVRVHKMLDIMTGFAQQPEECVCCLVGMFAQEMSFTNEHLREGSAKALADWTSYVAKLLKEAKDIHKPVTDFDVEGVAWFLNSIWQGSMLIGKTQPDSTVVIQNLRHARDYVDSLFFGSKAPEKTGSGKNPS